MDNKEYFYKKTKLTFSKKDNILEVFMDKPEGQKLVYQTTVQDSIFNNINKHVAERFYRWYYGNYEMPFVLNTPEDIK